ncbi:MAG TPA: class I SAM-dependent methyltransferase [Streptomyces sp.]|nr:class I SAM-dependent methyltransferase [Streptomyces sp.]
MHTHHHQDATPSDLALAEMLELDAQVLHAYLTDLTGWLDTFTDGSTERILDAGSGPGTGTLALADRFPRAGITAVDLSPQMLHRLAGQATAHGVADRVRTLQVDLDEPWPGSETGEPFDLVWSAAFWHHLQDPDRALRQALGSLRPRGLLAITEMDFFPRFLPEDAGAGRPGLESRLHAATNPGGGASDWSDHIDRAGFTLEAHRPVTVELSGPPTPTVRRYARVCLTRLREHAEGELAAEDLAALDALLDDDGPLSVAHRDDMTVRTTRTTWVARRP